MATRNKTKGTAGTTNATNLTAPTTSETANRAAEALETHTTAAEAPVTENGTAGNPDLVTGAGEAANVLTENSETPQEGTGAETAQSAASRADVEIDEHRVQTVTEIIQEQVKPVETVQAQTSHMEISKPSTSSQLPRAIVVTGPPRSQLININHASGPISTKQKKTS